MNARARPRWEGGKEAWEAQLSIMEVEEEEEETMRKSFLVSLAYLEF